MEIRHKKLYSFINLFLGIVFLSLFSACESLKVENHKQKSVPLWTSYETIEEVFPNEEYIARIGFGSDELSAKLDADSELSSYFSQTIKTEISATARFSNQNNKTESQRTLLQDIKVEKEADFVALKHTDAFYDSKLKKYTVCAYIQRSDAWNLLSPKLEASAKTVSFNMTEAQKETELFTKILFLNRVTNESDTFYKNYFLAATILPKNAHAYTKTVDSIQKAFVEREKLKKYAVVYVKMSGESSERIKAKIENIFMYKGFSISASSSDYIYLANATMNVDIKKQDEIYISYPNISIIITNKEGKTFGSYSKQYERVSSYTEDSCERAVLHKIESDLKKSFLK